MKPVHQHDCDRCVYLGTINRDRFGDDVDGNKIDCYWCKSPSSPNLDSVIGRFGSNGPDYSSSLPPEAFAMGDEYLINAERWYLYAILQATLKGLYKKVYPWQTRK